MAVSSDQSGSGPTDADPNRDTVRLDDVRLGATPTVRLDPRRLSQQPTVRLPQQRAATSRRRAPLVVAAAAAVLWASVISLAPALAGAALTEGADTLRLGLASWLIGHGAPVRTSIGQLDLIPLALAALALWRLERAGLHTTRAIGARNGGNWRAVLSVAGAIGLIYGLVGGFAALALRGDTPTAAPARAVLTLALFGFVAGGFGALRATGLHATLCAWLPGPVRHGARAGAIAAGLMLAAGAIAAGLSLALGWREASELVGAYRTGIAGQAGITLLCLAFLPNTAVWAASYLLGPGFAVGEGATVSIAEVTVGGLPAVPLFAGLPDGELGGLGAVLMVTPVAIGALCAVLMARGPHSDRPLRAASLFAAALVAGPVAGTLLGLAAWASAGALGGQRLSVIGPVAWKVAAAGGGAVTVGLLLGVAVAGMVRGGRAASP
ncbi:cell division protein PerM [Pilimelia columellifera]|uniref:Integral membrane protein n=1 Tax=Pilimelia columellifera subsp. columellifera TaxID=706583 RepID=A0ABN3NES4_9ACTN